jgi:hypothetical protein
MRSGGLRLESELRLWVQAGRRARLWWRDDDARAPGEALDRLLAASAAHGAPLTLAVIPDGDLTALAQRLAGQDLVSVVQHGVDHENRREGPQAGEFPHHWLRLRVSTQVRAGWVRLQALPGVHKIYVPPWNDVHPQLAGALADSGYLGWSAAPETEPPPLPPRVDIHLDLLRWRGGARFRGEAKVLEALREQLAERRKAQRWDDPIGILTHHLVMDEPAWAFLDSFLAWTMGRRALTWAALPTLLPSVAAPSEVRVSATR